jgi:hypothetical protein
MGYIEKYADRGNRTNLVCFRRPDLAKYRIMPKAELERTQFVSKGRTGLNTDIC